MPKVCSIDKKPARGKLASAYWSWYPEQDKRAAYLMRYCIDHAAALINAIQAAPEVEELTGPFPSMTCRGCGGSTEIERDYIWAACYLPGMEVINVTLEFCFSCAVAFRAEIMEHGEKLPDRNGYVAGAPATSPWSRLIGT